MNENLHCKQVDYDVLQKMKYLDEVVSEVLRKWPPLVQPDRVCVKDYVFDDGNNLKFTIEKGSRLFITAYGIHHDAKYYADPEKFDPDRFSDENKGNIQPATYIPFGIGPRNCIGKKRIFRNPSTVIFLQYVHLVKCLGSRFALMEIKAIYYHVEIPKMRKRKYH